MKFSDKITLIKADITKQKVDAIVNAANSKLTGGGGVDGAIHRVAGDELYSACQKLGGCNTGDSKITDGYNLKAKYIIHTVGPIWRGGKVNESKLLSSCYKTSLKLAIQNGINSIAFPNISTGVYGFPKRLASEIAIKTVSEFLTNNESISEVLFVCFDDENYNLYSELII